MNIKGYIDELAGVGVPVHHEECVDALLEGLSSDYALVISVNQSKKHTLSIAEIDALLHGHETMLTMRSQTLTKTVIPVALEACMTVAVVAVPFLIEILDVVAVVLAEAVVVADLPIFSAKSVLSMGTMLMSVIS